MLQRYERKSIEEQLIIAREELAQDYQQLSQLSYEDLSNSDSAQLILNMITKLSSPVIGMSVLRNDLFQMQFPYLAQYEMIMDKAQNFYHQSIIQDLNRIRNDEPIMQVSKEEIRQCVQQLNWKINVERSSMLNESQQIGQNMDLMKFFEGVRNYQNWQENIRKQCFQRLKERSHAIQNQLTFKKGFILSKLQHQFDTIKVNNLSEIFSIAHRSKRHLKIFKIFQKLVCNKELRYFRSILEKSKEPRLEQILSHMFNRYIPKKIICDLRKIAIDVRNKKHQINNISNKMLAFKRNRQQMLKFAALKILNIKPMIKASHYTQGIQLITVFCKKIVVKMLMNALHFPAKIIFDKFEYIHKERLEFSFKELKKNSLQIIMNRPNVSDRVKGKILASLNKYGKQPINAKKAFQKWYLNIHENKFSKKIYNIWLQGNTSKFTFFMRLKNMVDGINKQKISKEMKNFVKILCQKHNKYETFNYKKMLSKWIGNTRRIRKIENMFKLLGHITNQTEEIFKKYSLDKFVTFCKKIKAVKQYCSKYLLQYTQNRKIAIEKWGNINNIKKQWGKRKLRVILLDMVSKVNDTQREVLNIFKQNGKEGRQKKIALCRKTINKDQVFLSRFFTTWKFNSVSAIKQQQINNQKTKAIKTDSLIGISNAHSKMQTCNLKEVIHKFKQHKILRAKRQDKLKNSFLKIIENIENENKQAILNVYKENWIEGKNKKERLIFKLVNSNVIKEKISLCILKNKSSALTQLQKRQKSTKIFDLMQKKMKQNYSIFNKKLFVGKVLHKIMINYISKVQASFNNWKAMPMRMRWNLRSKVIDLHSKLSFMKNNRLSECNQKFKSSLITSKLKKKKVVYMMACKYEMVIRKYFIRYYKNVELRKQDDQINIVSKVFEKINETSKNNLSTVFLAPPEWPKKIVQLQKMNEKVKKRVSEYLRVWQKNSDALKFLFKIAAEKKKRCLQLFNKVLLSKETRSTKKIIQMFHQNSRIQKLQINFLKRLCDSQAGKVIKGFMLWKNMPLPKNKERIGKATKFEFNLSKMVVRNLKVTLNAMKDAHYFGNQQKKYCIRKLVAKSCSGIGQYFDRWRQNKRLILLFSKNRKVQNLFQAIFNNHEKSYELLINGEQSKKKRKSLQIVEGWWNKQKKYCIKQWHKNLINLKMKDVSKKHLLRNLNNISHKFEKKLLFEKIITKFKQNSQKQMNAKKMNRTQSILKMIDNYEAHKRMLLNKTIDRIKFNQIQGNFLKNKAFHKFLMQKIGQVHKGLAIWNNLAQQAKENHKRSIATHNFDLMNETLKSNYRLIFARTRQQTIKKNTLDKIFKVQQIKFKGYFGLWRQRIKELKILGELDRQTKGNILQRISKIIDATSTQTIIKAIKKFQMNSKIQKVQRKFIERLLQTKSGKCIHAFKAWKTIPVNKMGGKYKNYQKFYFKLQHFYKDRIKFAHSIFQTQKEDGNLMKKQSILKLFQMTSLGIRRFYNRWTRLTKQKHILQSVNATMKAFESASDQISTQYMIMFQDERAYKIKIAAIEKLIAAANGTTQNYLNKWRNNVKQINLLKSMDKETKKKALSIFTKVMNNSSTGQVISIITKFQKNAKMVQISKAFFNKLMNTKTGKVLKFFEKLKTVPDAKLNKRKKRGIIFESRLNNFVLKKLRDTLLPFKDNTYQAISKKKYCLDRLLRACMGQNQKKFLIWRNINREAKILSHTSLFDKTFQNMENVYRENFQIATKDASSEIQKKKALCRKLLNNSLFVQHHAYMIWKQAYHIDDLNILKKQNITQSHLKNLSTIFNKNQTKNVIQAIGVFRKILQLRNFEQFNYYKDYKNKKCIAFCDSLQRLNDHNKYVLIGALKTNQAQSILAQKSKKILTVFQNMQQQVKTNMAQLLRTEQQTALLNKTFSQLFSNTTINLDRVFNIWREKKNEIDMKKDFKDERKYKLLLTLNQLLIQLKNNKISQNIQQFKQNYKISKIKREICLTILRAKSNKVQSSFVAWKKLPYQQAKKLKNKATKFQQNLIKFMINRLKQVNDCFKKQCIEGIHKKQNAVRSIVRSKLIDSSRLFFKWRKINNQNKITEKIISLDRFMGTAKEVFNNNFSIFEGVKIQDQKKIQTITKLFNNNVSRLRDAYEIWRKSAKSNKLHTFERYMRHFNPQDFNKRLMRIGFMMIQKRKDMQALKGYINSLWKWKMSNIQATYYTKFIKVFKQSEQLIKLSNLLNKKIYQSQHHAFRYIMEVGHQRTNRKKQIVEKYFTKKLRTYFITFKNGVQKTEINIWRSKFTQSIKVKIYSDVLTAIVSKTKYAAFNTIRNYYHYTNKIIALQQTINNYQMNEVKHTFDMIKGEGHNKFTTVINEISTRIQHRNMMEAFLALKQKRQIQKLQEIINRTVYKNLMYNAFYKLNRRKQQIIKSKLSIILLQTLIQQAKTAQIKEALSQFNKNRVKRLASEKLMRILNNKYSQYAHCLFDGGVNIVNVVKFLERYKRGQKLKKILQQQDQCLKKTYLNKMRKKQNKWMQLAIQKFATRASIRSSPAICLWRLKTYAINS